MGRARSRPRSSSASPVERKTTPHSVVLSFGAVVLLALMAYSGSFQLPLVRDSAGLIQADPRVREASLHNLRWIWRSEYWLGRSAAPLYRPVTTTSFLVDYAVLGNGERPLGYHVVNWALHVFNALLVGALLRRLGAAPAAAALAAGVFAVHPVATEAVTYVAGRADLLAAGAVLGGLLLHAEAVRRPRPWPWRAALFTVGLLGVLAKENAALLLPLVWVFDAMRVSAPGDAAGPPRRAWASHAALILALGLAGLARQAALRHVVHDLDPFVDNPLGALSFVDARLTALKVAGYQLFLLVWPLRLSCDYSYDTFALHPTGGVLEHAKTAVAGSALAAIVAAAIVLRRRAPRAALLAAFLLIALLPTSNLVVRIGSIFAERFLYLPLAAFAGLVGLGFEALRARLAPTSAERFAHGAAAILLIAYTARTHVRNADWRDEETLFRAARGVCPRSYRVHRGLAQALLRDPAGPRLDEAVAAAEEAVRIVDARPLPPIDRSPQTLLVLATAYMMKGDRLAEAGPSSAAAAAGWYRRAGDVLRRAVETDRAVNARVAALSRTAGRPEAEIRDVGLGRIYDALGKVHMRLGEPAEALAQFEYLRHLEPAAGPAYLLPAVVLSNDGRPEDGAVMALAAWLLDEPPQARTILVELYRHLDPARAPFRADGTLDVTVPRVRSDAARACETLRRQFEQSKTPLLERVRRRCDSLTR